MAITLVSGQVGQGSTTGTSLNVVLPNNPTAGNLVVLGVVNGGTTQTATCVDSNGNAYTPTPGSPATAGGARVNIFYLKDAPDNASKTITVTLSASAPDIAAHVAEFAGANKTAPFDVEAAHVSGTSQTNINDPTVTPSANNSLLFAICSAGGGMTTVNSPWTAIGTVTLANWAEYIIQTTKQAQAISFTQSGAAAWIAAEAVFKIAGTGQIINATSTTTTTLSRKTTQVIDAIATSTAALIKRALKPIVGAIVTSSSFVSATQVFVGSTNKIINATVTTTSSVRKGISRAIAALVTTTSFVGNTFRVTLNATVITAMLLISSTFKTVFSFGIHVIKALDQNVFATRRTIFAYQEQEPGSPPIDISGSFTCDVSGGAGLWSGASGTFNLDFDD